MEHADEITDVVRVTVEEGALPSGSLVHLCECGHDENQHYDVQTYFAENQKFITSSCGFADCSCVRTITVAYRL